MKELTIEAKIENLEEVLAFVDEQLERLNCPVRQKTHLDVAVEELYVNIAQYAYDPEIGWVKLEIEVNDDPLSPMIRWRKRTRTSRCPRMSGRSGDWVSIWSRKIWKMCAMNIRMAAIF